MTSEPTPKLALVTGGRDFIATAETLPALDAALGDVALVIEGMARGFDTLVHDRSQWHRIQVQPAPAFWRLAHVLGVAAGLSGDTLRRRVGKEGSTRNARMLRWGLELADAYGLEVVLIAGPGGTGTANMRAICVGIPVREIPGRMEKR